MRGKRGSIALAVCWAVTLIILGALADGYIAPHGRSGDGAPRRKTHLTCGGATASHLSPTHLTRLPAPMEPVETLEN